MWYTYQINNNVLFLAPLGDTADEIIEKDCTAYIKDPSATNQDTFDSWETTVPEWCNPQ